jgi:hypothetical protein
MVQDNGSDYNIPYHSLLVIFADVWHIQSSGSFIFAGNLFCVHGSVFLAGFALEKYSSDHTVYLVLSVDRGTVSVAGSELNIVCQADSIFRHRTQQLTVKGTAG